MFTADRIIAVVDDSPSALRGFGKLLSLHGFRVSLYSSAEEFLAEPLARAAELAIIDINLGLGMSGTALAGAIRQSGQNMPIILMSADPQSIIDAQAEHLLGVTILEKPFSIEVLCEIIKVSLIT